ncbi:MAG TPA: response regulator transcription factor [Balneolaceae bacterium]|nr:response regulator transcription factor [Balneolaceae bacterium]
MSHTSKSILVVEDNKDLVNLLEINLSDEGYNVQTAMDGEAAIQAFQQTKPSLIILDVMLPKMDGFDVCKQIRSQDKQVPILMLTAKSEEVDKVLGLEIGADDYMTKPFSIREFLARVKAILRRANRSSSKSEKNDEKLSYKDLVADPNKRRVTLRGESIELTSKEYDLLLLFFSNPGKAYSREELLNVVWGYSYEGYSHTVNSHINRLRSKIEDDPSDPDYIKTVWGVGYRFTDTEKEANHA